MDFECMQMSKYPRMSRGQESLGKSSHQDPRMLQRPVLVVSIC